MISAANHARIQGGQLLPTPNRNTCRWLCLTALLETAAYSIFFFPYADLSVLVMAGYVGFACAAVALHFTEPKNEACDYFETECEERDSLKKDSQ